MCLPHGILRAVIRTILGALYDFCIVGVCDLVLHKTYALPKL